MMKNRVYDFNVTIETKVIVPEKKKQPISESFFNSIVPHAAGSISMTPGILKTMLGRGHLN